MMDLSWSELLVCGVIALVVIGPKELPKTLKHVSHGVRHIRKLYRQVISGYHALEREVDFATGQGKPRTLLGDMMIPDISEDELDAQMTPPASHTKQPATQASSPE